MTYTIATTCSTLVFLATDMHWKDICMCDLRFFSKNTAGCYGVWLLFVYVVGAPTPDFSQFRSLCSDVDDASLHVVIESFLVHVQLVLSEFAFRYTKNRQLTSISRRSLVQ